MSSYDMLQRFMELKPYLDQLSASAAELEISLKEWNLLMDVVDSLKPLKSASGRVSFKDRPLSEFYKIWITCFLKTKKIGKNIFSHVTRNCYRMNEFSNYLPFLILQAHLFRYICVKIWINEKVGL